MQISNLFLYFFCFSICYLIIQRRKNRYIKLFVPYWLLLIIFTHLFICYKCVYLYQYRSSVYYIYNNVYPCCLMLPGLVYKCTFCKKVIFFCEKFGCYYFLSYLCTRFYGQCVCRAVVGHRSLIGFTWTESSTRSVCRSFRDGRWVKETTLSFF